MQSSVKDWLCIQSTLQTEYTVNKVKTTISRYMLKSVKTLMQKARNVAC